MSDLKTYTKQELSEVISKTAASMQVLANGLDKQNEALKEMALALMELNKNIRGLYHILENK